MYSAGEARRTAMSKKTHDLDTALAAIEHDIKQAAQKGEMNVNYDYSLYSSVVGLKEALIKHGYTVENVAHYDGGYYRVSW